jgi:hypothetical protein
MTTYQGIACVTQTLSYLVGNAVRKILPEAIVTVAPPEAQPAASRDAPRLNIYLVQALPEPTMRSADLPIRASDGQLSTPPQVALRLWYLFSFFGSTIRAQLMLGAAEVALRENGVLNAALISQALAGHPELAGSGIEHQSPPVTMTPSLTTLAELSRFWSGFFQMPYTLSTLYEASVVLLTSALPATGPGLPVTGLAPGSGRPTPTLSPFAPVTFAAGLPVPVIGNGVRAGQFLRIGDAWVPIKRSARGGLTAALPAAVRAGTTLVRLGQLTPAGPGAAADAAGEIPGTTPQPLVIRPVLSDMTFVRSAGAVEANVKPPPAAGQRIALTLTHLKNRIPSVRIGPIVVTGPEPGRPRFPVPAAALSVPGAYLGQIEVDDVSSIPTSAGGRFASPRVAW